MVSLGCTVGTLWSWAGGWRTCGSLQVELLLQEALRLVQVT